MFKFVGPFFVTTALFACTENAEDTNENDKQQDTATEAETSAYGTCSLELVAASFTTYSALTVDATNVKVQMAFIRQGLGSLNEVHDMQKGEESEDGVPWALELEEVETMEEYVPGETTLWSFFDVDDQDLIYTAHNEDGLICDCWNLKSAFGEIDCDILRQAE